MVCVTKHWARFIMVLAVTSVLFCSAALAGTPGEAGVLSLRIGVGAREAGMGGAGVAASQGASAVFWNPANNIFADFQTELLLQHQRWLGLFDQEAAAVAHRLGPGVLGVMFTGLYSDPITRYGLEPVGIPEGTFEPYDVAFGVSYAHPLGDKFAVAAAAKMIYERIDIYSDTGFAFDFFVTHKAVIKGLTFAASATNLGGQMNLDNQPFDLPSAFRLGFAWIPQQVLFDQKLLVVGDVFMPSDTNEKAHLGAEYRLIPEFALRLGSKINYDTQGLTAGAGFIVGRLGLDYAYEDMKVAGFDSGHKFSLRMTW